MSLVIAPENRAYRPYGSAIDVLTCKEEEFIVEGPAGTGKSRAALERLHACAEKYPGMRGLIARKTRASMTETCLVTFEEKVVPLNHPILENDISRAGRRSYIYPNGSELICQGFDNMTKIMSADYDLVYVQEAIEIEEDHWEKAATRLRNGRMPYQQLFGDTNPDIPTHWIKIRERDKLLRCILSRHEDNPYLYDHELKRWTEAGAKYIDRLDRLKGVRKRRYRYGEWCQAEGAIYEGYDPAVHKCFRFEPGPAWPRHWSFDFGYINPFVWQEWVESPDGEFYLYREIYMTRTLVRDHGRMIKSLMQYRPATVVGDHDSENRKQLELELGITIEPAYKAVKDGIQQVQAAMEVVEVDGGKKKTRFHIMEDTLVHPPDPYLVEAKLPVCTAEEIPGYVWDMSQGRKTKEEPVKENDHGCDAMRYRIAKGRANRKKKKAVAGGASRGVKTF